MAPRFVRRLAVTALVFAILVAALAVGTWIAAHRYGPTLARDRIASALTAALGREVSVERVDIQPWQGRVVIEGIRAAADPGSDDPHLVTIGRVEAHVGIASLWEGRLVLRRLAVQDVDARIAATEGPGLTELPLLPEVIHLGLAEVRLLAVELARARVVYRDAAAGLSVDLSGLGVTARPGAGATALSLSVERVAVAAGALAERVERVAGELRIHPDQIDVPSLALVWNGRPLSITGRVDHPLGAATLALAVRGEVDLAPIGARMGAPWPVAGVATVAGRVDGAVDAPALALDVSSGEVTAGPVTARRLAARIAWSAGALRLSDVRAHALDGQVAGALHLDTRRPESARVDVELNDVSLASIEALAGSASGVSARLDATLETTGDLGRPRALRGAGRLKAREVKLPGALLSLGPGSLSVEGRVADETLDLEKATGAWPGFAAEASGRLGADGPARLSLSLLGDLARVGELLGRRDVSGRVLLDAALAGRWSALTVTGRLHATQPAVATWRADEATIPFEAAGRSLRLDGATARLGESRLEVSGAATVAGRGPLTSVPPGRDVALALAVQMAPAKLEDFGPWLPEAARGSGAVTVAARVDGTLERWRVTGRAESKSVAITGFPPAEDVSVTYALTPEHVDLPSVVARILGVPVRAQGRATWAGAAQGQAEVGPVDLARLPGAAPPVPLAGTARATVTASVRGGVVDADAAVRVERLVVAGFALGAGTGEARLRGNAITAQAAFPEAKGQIAVDGRLDGGAPIAARARVIDLALGPLVERFAPEARGYLDGVLSATAELAVPWRDPAAARGFVRLEPVRLDVWGERWEARGPIVVRREPGRTVIEQLAMTGRTGEVTGEARLDDAGTVDARLHGTVPLSIVPTFVPAVTDVAGTLEIELRAGGTRAAPTLAGQGRISSGLLALRATPQVLRNIEGRFTVRPDRLRVDDLRGEIAGGTVQVSGDVSLDGRAVGPYQLRLAARHVSGAPVPGLDALWDADLEVTGRGARGLVRGEARLLRALYTRELALLPMLLERSAREAEPGFGSDLRLQVAVRLQDNLVVRTRQAQIRGGGTLSLQGTVAAPVVFGALETREGTVRFQRHRFTLERAVVRFDDPRGGNPLIDLRATARIRTWDVTMDLSGRASDLQVRLSSSPPMSQEDLLALVTLGATREELGRSPGPIFAAEAGRLLAEGFLGLGDDTQLLDVFEVETKEDGAQVTVGRRFGERTLITYSGSFADGGKQKLRVEYQLIGPVLLAGEQDFRGGFAGDVIVRLRFR